MKQIEDAGQRRWSRRQFTKYLSSSVLAAGTGLLTPARADQPDLIAAARKEGRVTVYGDSSMVPQLVEGFQKRYPDIRVTSVTGGGWQTYNRMMVEKDAGRMLADVLCANDDTLLAGYQAGVFADLETTGGYPADAVSKSGYVITQRMLTPLIFNKEATKSLKMPTDWEDFAKLGSEWKGLIISADPRNSGTALCVLMALYQVLGKERATGVLEAWKKLGVEIAPNTGVQVAKIMSGERPLTVTMHMAFYKSMHEKGAPVGFSLPTSGSMMQVGAMSVPREAPHPKAGRLFVDFVMSSDGAAIMSANGTYPSSTETMAPEGFPARKSIKIMGEGPAESLRDRNTVIDWWKSAMGVT